MTSVPVGTDPTILLAYDTGNGTCQIVNESNPLPTTAQLNGNVTVGNITVVDGNITTHAAMAGNRTVAQTSVGNVSVVTLFATNASSSARTVRNTDGNVTVYLGKDGNVTTSNGYPLPAGQVYTESACGAALTAISATGTVTVAVIGLAP